MIRWLAWFFVAPHLFWLDGVLATTAARVIDIGLAVALVLALSVRTAALPGLLLIAALARSLLYEGGIALHFLALGLPIAVLVPLRGVFFRASAVWQGAAAAFLAVAVPRVGMFFAARTGAGALVDEAPGVLAVLGAMVLVPPTAWLLRSLPPLQSFAERTT
jgi:hypothetical protein